jgi:hypothetical protein
LLRGRGSGTGAVRCDVRASLGEGDGDSRTQSAG